MYFDWMSRLIYLAMSLFLLGNGPILSAQVPLVADRIAEQGADEQIELQWRLEAGDRALESGLANLAETIYRSVLDNVTGLSVANRAELNLSLAKSLIAQKRFVAAQSQMEEVPREARSSQHALYLAIAIYGEGGNQIDVDAFREALAQVDAVELLREDRSCLLYTSPSPRDA